MPAEDIIDGRALLLVNLTVDLLLERCKKHDRQLGVNLLHFTSKVKDIGLTNVVHRKHEIKVAAL